MTTTVALSLVTSGFILAGFALAGSPLRARSRTYLRILAAVLVAQVAVDSFSKSYTYVESIALCILASCAAGVVAAAFVERTRGTRAWLARARDPLVLDAPFEGEWMVAAGGPVPGENHHQLARDQYFAYDFVRRDRKSLGRAILAPLDGRVVAARDGMEDRPISRLPKLASGSDDALGNHVIIASGSAYVLLCHLQKGSVGVRVGQEVRSGERIGSCGNSGRTTGPHLHIHAQDEPTYSFGRANGIPIAFRHRGEAKLLRRSGVLSGR